MSNTGGKVIIAGILAYLLWPRKKKETEDPQFGTNNYSLAFAPFEDTMYIHIMSPGIHEVLVVPPQYDGVETVEVDNEIFSAGWDFDKDIVYLSINDGMNEPDVLYIDEHGSVI